MTTPQTPPPVPAPPLVTDPEHPTTPAEPGMPGVDPQAPGEEQEKPKYDGGEIPRVDTDPLDDDQMLNDDQV